MYAEIGSKQVAIVRMDEKQAFTLLVSIAADGTILPFQAVYQGKMKLSLPAVTPPNYDNAINAGFKLVISGMKTYWSNFGTMCIFVNEILTPYFEATKLELCLPPQQKSLWQIDIVRLDSCFE